MDGHEVFFASAGRDDQVRALTSSEATEYEEHRQTVRKLSAAARFDEIPNFRLFVIEGAVLDGPEHGLRDDATLCGMPEADLFVMRHPFFPGGPFACQECAAVARNDPESIGG